ncbi:hypothetical protein FNU76_01240 [Chitinimonas arctica]|uniref:RbmA-like FnIII domain-containing protein n=1 Tax=Chitinimonas arctica TaxID=2594795 RepID=A0A516SAA6_9NEIS|nr:hypothetical protein [Chitinimonas arctica]QDQ25085.1 hypothetical protein FNU76_01240 [Chitinimonas arctica]
MKIKHALIQTALVSVATLAQAQLLFDVKFSSPPNTHGQPIVVDGSARTPSRITMGAPDMLSNFAGLPGNWGVFNTPQCNLYDQIQFNLPAGIKSLYIDYDIYTQQLNNSENAFSLYLDSSDYGARSMTFHGKLNTISLFNKGGRYSNFGSFSDLRKYAVSIYASTTADILKINIDGSTVHDGPLGSSDLNGIRMSLSPATGAATVCNKSNIAVSNIKVYETPADLETLPPVKEVDVELALQPGAPTTVPAGGGYVMHRRTIRNTHPSTARNIRYWAYTVMPNGLAYPLLPASSRTLAGGGQITESASFFIPAWFAGGNYVATLVGVDERSGALDSERLVFGKSMN